MECGQYHPKGQSGVKGQRDGEVSWVRHFLSPGCCQALSPTILPPSLLLTKTIEQESKLGAEIHLSSVFSDFLPQQSLLTHLTPGTTAINLASPTESLSTQDISPCQLLSGALGGSLLVTWQKAFQ